MRKHHNEIDQIHKLEMAKFRKLSGINNLRAVRVDKINNDGWTYLKQIYGNNLPAFKKDETINVEELTKSLANHIKVVNSSMDLPKMLKVYSYMATEYEGRNKALPLIQNIKNAHESIKKIATK